MLPVTYVLLDASGSHDALGSEELTFLWEEVEGPVDTSFTSHSKLLELSHLKQGNYKFK